MFHSAEVDILKWNAEQSGPGALGKRKIPSASGAAVRPGMLFIGVPVLGSGLFCHAGEAGYPEIRGKAAGEKGRIELAASFHARFRAARAAAGFNGYDL